MPKPSFIVVFEQRLGEALPLHPNVLSALKLFVVTPLMFLTLRPVAVLEAGPYRVAALFLSFVLLDYFDGVVARARRMDSQLGRVFDRVTDYPLLLVVSFFCMDVLPLALLATKLGLDLLLLLLFVAGRGSTENRLRTTLSYTTLVGLLFLSQGWLPGLFHQSSVVFLLWTSIIFSSIVVVHNLDILQKRFIADLLSGANLLCGVFSMVFAARGRLEVSLLFLVLGAAFDGFDGAAARRWGGTRWGVYSDDVADGVNYGIAPGVALMLTVDGIEGVVLGLFYIVFTVTRLVYFTLNKGGADPNFFAGVPSTVGGLITLSSLILFREQPALVGLMVGVACAQMVSFSASYRHLGRALSGSKKALVGALFYMLVVVLGTSLWSVEGSVALVLAGNLVYGFLPAVTAFMKLARGSTG